MTDETSDANQHYDRVVDDLADRVTGVHERDVVAKTVAEARAELEAEARVDNYLPVLTAKLAHTRLNKTAAGPAPANTI